MARPAGDPRTVVYCDSDPAAGDAILPHLPEDYAVEPATTAAAMRDALEGSACVVATESLPDATTVEILETVRSVDSDLPVVVYPREARPELAEAVSAFGATRYVPGSADNETLASRIHDAAECYERHASGRRSRELVRSMFDQYPYHFYVKDEEARYVEMTDIPDIPNPSEVRGKTEPEAFPHLQEAEQVYEDDREVIETGEPVMQREDLNHSRQSAYWTEVTKVPWYDDDGEIKGLIGSSLDIYRRKGLEQKVEERRLLHRRLTRYLSHDLRNPLNLARGHLEAVRESPDVGSETVEAIASALDRIETVVENMDVVIGGAQSWDVTDVPRADLAAALDDAWQTVDTGDASLHSEVAPNTEVLADPSPLQELFENVFRNAVEHGGPDVTVTVGTFDGGFYVADDGAGLAGDADELMEEGVSTTASNSGLGLTIVSEIADTYGWSVEAAESADGGARFEIHDCQLVTQFHDDVTVVGRQPIEESRDVGSPSPPGGARSDEEGIWIVSGGGENIWHETNEHHFAYARVETDVRLTARLTDLERIEEFTKAGVMIRDGLGESDSFGFVGRTADHGTEVLWRASRESHTWSKQLEDATELPHWLRIDRIGDCVTVFLSPHGRDWTPIDQRSISLSDPIFVGLAVCSHDSTLCTEARFDSVDVELLDAGNGDGA